MRRLAPCLLLTAFLMAVTARPARSEFFTVRSFAADVSVEADGDLIVREEIVVDFSSPRHGIYRDLPFLYTDSLGGKVRTPLKILAVVNGAGAKRRYKVTRGDSALRVRIGHPRKYVSGRQAYVIAYRVRNALLRLPDRDELAWNVNGNDWEVPMAAVASSVTLPPGEQGGILDGRCYTGLRGSSAGDCRTVTGDRSARFETTRSLLPGEGMTVAVGWRKGIVGEPSALNRLLLAVNAGENWVFLVPLLALGLLFRQWNSVGRDPATGSVAVMFAPPQHKGLNLQPAEVGGLVDERFDSRDLTAAVVGLAVKGLVTIEERGTEGILFSRTDYYLGRVKDADEVLTPFEKELMDCLFPGGRSGILISELKNSFYVHLEALRDRLFDGLVGKGYFRTRPGKVRMWYRSAAMVLCLLGFVAGRYAGSFFYATSEVKNLIAFLLPGLALLLVARHMPAKTRRGAWAAAEILGFEEFLSRAEKDRLERMKDLNIFERFLPYAIALGVSERWAAAFQDIAQEPPRWYTGSTGWQGGFHPASFNDSLGSALSSMKTNMFAAPRGSGRFSGGGGSSGGGFGGGGGGSW